MHAPPRVLAARGLAVLARVRAVMGRGDGRPRSLGAVVKRSRGAVLEAKDVHGDTVLTLPD